MKRTVDIDIQIRPGCSVPKIVIQTDRITPEIDSIVCAIENSVDDDNPMVTAYDGDTMVLLSQREIIRVFVENRRLVVCTEKGSFVARKTLAELESRLNRSRFLRISRSEIINLYKVSNFDFSLSGTIHVHFDDGSSTWAARRYVRSIQQTLGLM